MRQHRIRVGQRYSLALSNNSSANPSRGTSIALKPSATAPLRIIAIEIGEALKAATIIDYNVYWYGVQTHSAVSTAPSSSSMTQFTPQPEEPGGPAATFEAWYGVNNSAGGGTTLEYFPSMRVPIDMPWEHILPREREIIVPANGLARIVWGDANLAQGLGNYHAFNFSAIIEELK